MAALTASVRNVAFRVAEPPRRDQGDAPQPASVVARRRLPQVEFRESALETGGSKKSFTKYPLRNSFVGTLRIRSTS